MPVQGWANLSVEEKRYDKLRRSFDSNPITTRSFSAWAMETLENVYERAAYLKKVFAHYRLIENHANLFIIEDRKHDKLVKVEWRDNRLVCNDKDPNYILFASLHPDLRLK